MTRTFTSYTLYKRSESPNNSGFSKSPLYSNPCTLVLPLLTQKSLNSDSLLSKFRHQQQIHLVYLLRICDYLFLPLSGFNDISVTKVATLLMAMAILQKNFY
uniref:Uncharacterized protein n=1 Tax=Solanum lycopersicum TaxID=4081 RepID=A0A3Q7GXI5_SOLLC